MFDKKVGESLILNLGDGLTTCLSYLIPMAVYASHIDIKAMLIGGVGGAVSMSMNLADSENGNETTPQIVTAFLSSAAGGILPVIPFIFFREPYSSLLAAWVVLVGVFIIITVKAPETGYKRAVKQVSRSFLIAVIIVSLLSLF